MEKFDSFAKDHQKLIKREKSKRKLYENFDLFFFRNSKQVSMGIVEFLNNTVFHGLDTLKVRLQAKSQIEDVSHFYKNKMQHKPLISGVTSAGIGAFLAGFCFVSANENLLHYFFRKNKQTLLDNYNWKAKIIVSFLLSDIAKATVFLPFEARKQRIQLGQKVADLGVGDISKYMLRAYFPMVIKDVIFRIVILSSFLFTLNVEHKPVLKYNLSEIKELIHHHEQKKERVNVSYFMDYSKFNIYSPFHYILINLVLCTVAATVITHPLDVIATKILTQTRLKYKGLFQSYSLIAKEEGIKKLFYSGLSVRISFNLFSAMNVLILYEGFNSKIQKYYNEEES